MKKLIPYILTAVITAVIVGGGIVFRDRLNEESLIATDFTTAEETLAPSFVSDYPASCFSVIDPERFMAEINDGEIDLPYTYVDLDKFFNNQRISELRETSRLGKICFWNNALISFMFCEEDPTSPEAILGIYTVDDELVIDKGKGICGDLSNCSMQGLINGDLFYSCGRGDGPWSEGKTYVLNIESGQSKLIRDCYYGPEGTECEVDMLGFY